MCTTVKLSNAKLGWFICQIHQRHGLMGVDLVRVPTNILGAVLTALLGISFAYYSVWLLILVSQRTTGYRRHGDAPLRSSEELSYLDHDDERAAVPEDMHKRRHASG